MYMYGYGLTKADANCLNNFRLDSTYKSNLRPDKFAFAFREREHGERMVKHTFLYIYISHLLEADFSSEMLIEINSTS